MFVFAVSERLGWRGNGDTLRGKERGGLRLLPSERQRDRNKDENLGARKENLAQVASNKEFVRQQWKREREREREEDCGCGTV